MQVSRSIGDVHLKAVDHSGAGGVLSAEPSLHERQLSADDRFLIFASDGLWDVMSDQEAVDIVHKGPSNVSTVISRDLTRISLILSSRWSTK
jgi:pyruvate dehydrogenase phosphatase